ncbi:MAG: GNA1162 family protein, partial [candidate division NC10 bacterium]
MPEGSRPAGVTTVRTDLPQRIAILPLVNGTERREAPEVIRAALQQQLNATPYTVQKIFLTDELLARGGLGDAEQAATASLAELGRLLNVDAVLVGRATDYTPIYAIVYAQVAVGASLKLVDVRSGAVLWEGAHVQRSHGGSAAVSPWGLVVAAGMTALHLRDAEFLHVTDDLARELVAGMPVSTVPRAFRPPAIAAVAADAVGETRRAGQAIQVAVVGPPGLRGSFDLIGLRTGLPLEEREAGVYRGAYVVADGDTAGRAIVVGALVDGQGLRGERQDGRGTIRIDTTPPVAPGPIGSTPGDGTIQLRWSGVADADLAGYRVYRSDRPLSGFTVVLTTEDTHVRDSGLVNFASVYYRVSAVDTSGNESPLSVVVAAMPIPPGPTIVRGEITGKARWLRAASPYVLGEEVLVASGATLEIEPGVRVLSQGG